MKSLFGYANTTKAIAKSGGWNIFDDKFTQITMDDNSNLLLPSKEFDANKSKLEITSPGFCPNHYLIKSAKNLISEYDYFAKNMPKSLWISGTNGKTTTTKMCQFLLKDFGSQMGGNVGTALGDLDLDAKLWILETSSFTMHYTKFAKPDIYFLLPITPDHLSWHGTLKEYEKAKLKPITMMNENSVAILPKKFYGIESNAQIYFYEDEFELAKIFNIKIEKINFKIPFLMDAIFALIAQSIILEKCDYDLLNTFKIENNKLEEILDKKNRLWVNDTKATNIDASIKAIQRFSDKEILIILGGDDKGVDLSPIFYELKNLNISPKIFTIGSNTDKLTLLAQEFNLICFSCYELKQAVEQIDKYFTNQNAVALLSPACASLDQFSSYAQRGEIFKQNIQNLKYF